jgi:hypothetical protein
MSRLRSLRWTVLLCALACVIPARAPASTTMQSSMMDDQQLLYYSPGRAIAELKEMKALGIDVVKVSLVWSVVAPDANAHRQPRGFNPADPGDYPAAGFTRYDRLVTEAHKLGLRVYFMLTPPAPTWAIPQGNFNTQSKRLGFAPSQTQLRAFAQAVGTRYSGNFEGLPRVDFWGIWNEPNFPAWLSPLHRHIPGVGEELLEPMIYRGLVNAAWSGLAASGHTVAGGDTILIGETSNSGVESPGLFIRDLYCVGPHLGPLIGTAAEKAGCPTSGNRASFVSANPGLFGASGWAHHPYSFNVAPNRRYPLGTWYTLYNLGSLEGMLKGIFASYRVQVSPSNGEIPVYLTEFGYESNPPNPYVRNSTSQQASWLNQAEYMAWRDPYVQLMTQFELIDSRPRAGEPVGSHAYWGTFQTGLEFVGGQPKPALDAFRLPIWLPDRRHGNAVTVWGQLRPADHTTTQVGLVEYEPRGSSTWQANSGDAVYSTNSEGFFLAHVPIPSAGNVRLAWVDPATNQVLYSRTVGIG